MLLLLSLSLGAAPDIVVTGRDLAALGGEAAAARAVIDRARLTGTASGRLEDVLRDVAGLQQFRRSDARSANPTSQGLTLRGLGGNAASRALLVLDGVPQADPFGGWVAFPAYQPERLGRVTVTRGAGLFAPGALAGTIALDSATPDQLAPVALHMAGGSRGSVEANAALTGQMGRGFATVSADYARGDGFVPIRADQRGPADRPAGHEQASLGLRAVIDLGGQAELQAAMLAFSDRRDRGLAFSDNRSDGADASLRLVGRGRWGWSALAYVQARAFASQFGALAAGRTAVTPTLDQYNTPATGLGGRIEVRPPLGGGAELSLGGDWRATEGRTLELFTFVAGLPTRRREAGGRSAVRGGFADLSWTRGGWTLSAGGRIDRWTISGGRLSERVLATGAAVTDSRFADRGGWEGSGRAGLAFAPGGGLTLRAAAYTGWRLPTLNELYRPFRVGADATAANAALAPERVRGAELGLDYAPRPEVRLGVTLFDNRLDGAIANVTIARGPGQFPGVGFVSAAGVYRRRENLDAVRARGVELDGAARLGRWTAALSYAHADAVVRGAGLSAALDGLRPAQTPRHMASATLGWDDGAAGGRQPAAASVTLRYVGAQFEDDQNQRQLGDALTLDARLTVPLLRGLAVEARAENLTDALVAAAISADGIVERATPRTLWLGLRAAL